MTPDKARHPPIRRCPAPCRAASRRMRSRRPISCRVEVAKIAAARHPRRHAGDARPQHRPSVRLAGQCRDRCRRRAADPGVEAGDPHRQSGSRRPRLAAAGRDRQRAMPLAHPRLTVLGTFAPVERDERRRAAHPPPLPRPPSEVGALCRLRRLRVLAHGRRLGASQWRLRPRRRPRRGRGADRCVGRRRADRGRGRRHRAHECRPRRGLPALRHQTARRARRRLALASASIPRARIAAGPDRVAARLSAARHRARGRCARCSSNSPSRRGRVNRNECRRRPDASDISGVLGLALMMQRNAGRASLHGIWSWL